MEIIKKISLDEAKILLKSKFPGYEICLDYQDRYDDDEIIGFILTKKVEIDEEQERQIEIIKTQSLNRRDDDND